jgi:HAD superfamily hydrolase (TIGR01457 family)
MLSWWSTPVNDMRRDRLTQIRGFLIDMDGTLYVGPEAMTGAVKFMAAIRRKGYPYLVLTNNSSREGRLYCERLGRLGMPTERQMVLTSGDASAHYLKHETPYGRPFILGTDALRNACTATGLEVAEATEGPDCVLLGYDITLTYASLTDACLLVAQGLPYFATHADRTCIDPRGLLPDAGAMIAAIETTTGRSPIVLGKPEQSMLDAALSRLGCSRSQTLIVGDQLDTDITMGFRYDVLSCLVMSGETKAHHLENSAIKPSLVSAHVGVLHDVLRESNVLG